MNKNPEATHTRLRGVVAGASGALAGCAGGAAFTNANLPPTVELAPGVAVEPSLAFGHPGLEVSYGATQMLVPHLGPGLNIAVSQLDVPLKGHALETVASLVSQYHSGVAEPIQTALLERLAVGGSIGAAIGGVIACKALQGLCRSSLRERLRQAPTRKLALVAAATGLAVGGIVKTNEYGNTSLNDSPPTALSSVITGRAPVLRGATMNGIGGELANSAAFGAVDYIDSVAKFWKKSAGSFAASFAAFEKGGSNSYAKNPNIISVLHLSDLHCNYANLKYYLGGVLRDFKPAIVVNTGDTTTNSGTMPYEKKCVSNFVDDVDKAAADSNMSAAIVNVAGNHDAKKPIHLTRRHAEMTTLTTKNSKATIDGITFVGSQDPRVTIWYPTLPKTDNQQFRALAKQGEYLATTACDIVNRTGEAPVVLSHSEQASYASVIRGCASLALNGHTHHSGRIKSFAAENGTTVLQHTVGSASGADVGLTIWEKPKQDATIVVHYFDKLRREFVGATAAVLHVDGSVDIRTLDAPKANASQSNVELAAKKAFVTDYASVRQTQLTPDAASTRAAPINRSRAPANPRSLGWNKESGFFCQLEPIE